MAESNHEALRIIERRLPERVAPLFRLMGEAAEEREETVYVVGGFVRDLLLGHENLDIDIVTEGDGIALARQVAAKADGKVAAHPRFGTAIVFFPDTEIRIDVSTARSERYPEPAALPEVSRGTIDDDLRRRDFTINCLAVGLRRKGLGDLLDPCGGVEDLRRRLIRVLHDKSFRDDPTRVVRAVRFAARFSFSIETKTRRWLRAAVRGGLLGRLTRERLRNEWLHIFEEPRPSRCLEMLRECGALGAVDPRPMRWPSRKRAMAWAEREVRHMSEEIVLDRSEMLLLTYLGDLSRVEFEAVARRLALPKHLAKIWRELEAAVNLWQEVRSSDGALTAGTIYRGIGAPVPEVLMALAAGELRREQRQTLVDYLVALSRITWLVGGDDLNALGIPEGPIYDALLKQVWAAQLDGDVETKRQAKGLAQRLWEAGQLSRKKKGTEKKTTARKRTAKTTMAKKTKKKAMKRKRATTRSRKRTAKTTKKTATRITARKAGKKKATRAKTRAKKKK